MRAIHTAPEMTNMAPCEPQSTALPSAGGSETLRNRACTYAAMPSDATQANATANARPRRQDSAQASSTVSARAQTASGTQTSRTPNSRLSGLAATISSGLATITVKNSMVLAASANRSRDDQQSFSGFAVRIEIFICRARASARSIEEA